MPLVLTQFHSTSYPHALVKTPSLRNNTATSYLSSLFHSDITAWTDGSVPGGLGQDGAGIHIKCRLQSVSLLPPSPSQLVSGLPCSYSTETFAIPQILEWCISHSKTCNFASITLFSDSLSVLSTLSAPLPYLTPKSLFDTKSLLNIFYKSKIVHLQRIPGHSFLPGNDLADSC